MHTSAEKNKQAIISQNHSIVIQPSTNKKIISPRENQSATVNSDPDVINQNQVAILKTLLLPSPKTHIHQASALLSSSNITNTVTSSPAQSCIYNAQPYLPGDIVKTDQGWLRCTPTLFFSADNGNKLQTGNPEWTKVN
jgi:hypothetical protein